MSNTFSKQKRVLEAGVMADYAKQTLGFVPEPVYDELTDEMLVTPDVLLKAGLNPSK